MPRTVAVAGSSRWLSFIERCCSASTPGGDSNRDDYVTERFSLSVADRATNGLHYVYR